MRRLSLIAGVAALGVALTSTPAWANTTINVNPGQLGMVATQFTNNCDPNFGGGPYPGQDVWVFNLPGSEDVMGDFLSVTATFNGTITVTIPTDGGGISTGPGTSKAWISLPAGYTLTAASAEISGNVDPQTAQFVVTHTCTGGQTSSPSPEPSDPGESPSPDPSDPATSNPPTSRPPDLPQTGAAITTMIVTAFTAIAAGVALVLVMRRRRHLLDLED